MSNPAYSKVRPDCKLEYSWRDIQEAQKTGFEECKRKVLEILHKNANSHNPAHDASLMRAYREIKDLK